MRGGIYGKIFLLRMKEFLRAKPEETPEGEGVYLAVYPESSSTTDSISFYYTLG